MNIYENILLPTAEFLGKFHEILKTILFYNVFPNVKVIELLGFLGVTGIVTILILRLIRG